MNIRDKSFLITGGASLVGSHLTEILIEGGAKEVIHYDNLSFGATGSVDRMYGDSRVRLVRGDVLRLEQLMEAASGVDGLFNFAAFMTLPISKSPTLGLEVNAMGALNVLNAARLLGNKRVVLASSIAVYGNEVEGEVHEDRAFGAAGTTPAFAAYAASKLLGEHAGRLFAQKYGMRCNAVRFSTVYGTNQHSRGVNSAFIVDTIQAIKNGEAPVIIGTGDEAHDYLYASDAANGALMAMQHGKPGQVYNISSGVSTSVKDMVDIVLREYDSPLKPASTAETRTARSTAHAHLNISNARARADLGWSPAVNVVEGVARLRRWLDESAAA